MAKKSLDFFSLPWICKKTSRIWVNQFQTNSKWSELVPGAEPKGGGGAGGASGGGGGGIGKADKENIRFFDETKPNEDDEESEGDDVTGGGGGRHHVPPDEPKWVHICPSFFKFKILLC